MASVEHGVADVIIIGGSYAGLSAAMALGRALRSVLIIDSGLPCNRQAPHSHNFITQDGEAPGAIAAKAREQVLGYPTVRLIDGRASAASKLEDRFEVTTEAGDRYAGRKLLFATGVTDLMPDIPGFAECWGISVAHCPYCHGYEVRDTTIGVVGNGDMGFEFARLISNWTNRLTLFTDGPSTLTDEQRSALELHAIPIVEPRLRQLEHENGQIVNLLLDDESRHPMTTLFARTPFVQHCAIPEQLGCAIDEPGYIVVDDFKRTTVSGVYAAGDNTTMLRSVAGAVAAGGLAGAMINKELIEESFHRAAGHA